MNILHLKYAAEIAKTGSLNKAAENLYMGQPNLSRAIKELEASLGITIFVRSAKGMVTTAEGEEFLQHAKRILAQIEEVENIYKSGAPVRQRFSVSVPKISYIAEAFARFSKCIDISVPAELLYKETDSANVVKDILDSDCKLGIIRYCTENDRQFKEMLSEKGIEYELIAEFSYILLMNIEHPLANKDNICYGDLKPYVEITYGDPSVLLPPSVAVKKEEIPDSTDKHIVVFERGSEFELLCENKNTFMWSSYVPGKILDRYGLVQKLCRDNSRVYKDVMIYRKDYELTELDRRFITELCEAKRRCFNQAGLYR